MFLNPGELVSFLFGHGELHRMLGVSRQTPYTWARTGNIPTFQIRRILALAKESGVELTASDLIEGKDVDTGVRHEMRGGEPCYVCVANDKAFFYDPNNKTRKKYAKSLAEKESYESKKPSQLNLG